jgi:hypothetical protein
MTEEFAAADAGAAGEVVAAEEHAQGGARGEGEHSSIPLAVAIALVTVLGAVVAVFGSLTQQRASDLDQQGLREAARQEQIVSDLQAKVNQDVRNLGPYQEHLKAVKLLHDEADKIRSSDSDLADSLDAQAEGEAVLARNRQNFFQARLPDPGDAGKPVVYDAAAALQGLEETNDELNGLRPDATIAQADTLHTKAAYLAGLVTLFVAALLFFTLAQFARPSLRRIFTVAGAVVAVTALGLFVAVERTLP